MADFKRIVLILCVFVWSVSSSHGLETDKIVIAVDWGNSPFMYQNNNKADGIYPALIHAIFKRMGKHVEVKVYPWKRVLKMGREGKCGIGGIYKTQERLKIFDYSDPLYTETVLVYVRQKNTFEFNTLSDLDGKTIGVMRGWSYGDAFDRFRLKETITTKAVDNDHVAFKRLVQSDLDCLFSLELTGKLMLRKAGYQGRVVPLAKSVAVNDTYVAFAKTKGRQILLEKMNVTLARMKEDGSYKMVLQAVMKKSL